MNDPCAEPLGIAPFPIRPRGAVLTGVEANVVVVDGDAVVVVEVDVAVKIDVVVGAAVIVGGVFAPEELHAAPSTVAARSATHPNATPR